MAVRQKWRRIVLMKDSPYVSDIKLGDFLRIDKIDAIIDDCKCDSIVLMNTKKRCACIAAH